MKGCIATEELQAIRSEMAMMMGLSELEISQDDIRTFSEETSWPLVLPIHQFTEIDSLGLQLEQM